MDVMDTGITDKFGKPIREGDILQYRLDIFGKAHEGPTVNRVIRHGKNFRVVPVNNDNPKYVGVKLTVQYASRCVILDRAH